MATLAKVKFDQHKHTHTRNIIDRRRRRRFVACNFLSFLWRDDAMMMVDAERVCVCVCGENL